MLQLFALTVMVIPSDTVIRAIGAEGYVAALVGMFAFAAFLAATLLGLHDPLRHRHPVRGGLCLLWLSVLVSYILMDRGALTVAQAASADRLMMQLAVISGVATTGKPKPIAPCAKPESRQAKVTNASAAMSATSHTGFDGVSANISGLLLATLSLNLGDVKSIVPDTRVVGSGLTPQNPNLWQSVSGVDKLWGGPGSPATIRSATPTWHGRCSSCRTDFRSAARAS